jgi:hypothetical protein
MKKEVFMEEFDKKSIEDRRAILDARMKYCSMVLRQYYRVDTCTPAGQDLLLVVVVGQTRREPDADNMLEYLAEFRSISEAEAERSLREAMENYFGVLTWRDVYDDMLEDIIAEDEAEREGWDSYEDRIHAAEGG